MEVIPLSKSKILSGRQCDKRLWLERHRPELRAEDAGLEARLQAGTEVGVVARSRWPDGLLADEDSFERAVEATQAWTRQPDRPLFEGFFSYDDVRVRPDILVPQGRGVFDLYEVKSSTSVKPYHIADVAVQAWVLEGLGFTIRRIILVHIDNSFVYGGDGDYSGLFHDEDITGLARVKMIQVPQWVVHFRDMLAGDEPAIGVGRHCTDPFDCPFHIHCRGASTEYPVSLLPRSTDFAQALFESGFRDLREVPEDLITREQHKLIHAATVSGKPVANSEAGHVLRRLDWPRYHLDFETVGLAVPIWKGTRPYQQVGFQFSCHVHYADGELRHHEFLAAPDTPPMRDFARTVLGAVGAQGPILVYNAGFEKRILRETGEAVPYLAKSLEAVAARMVDLYPLTVASWYHPAMKGSWSLKAVLPTVAPDLDYTTLGLVTGGGEASEAIAEYIHPDTPALRRETLALALRKYCALDTMALVRLASHLEALA